MPIVPIVFEDLENYLDAPKVIKQMARQIVTKTGQLRDELIRVEQDAQTARHYLEEGRNFDFTSASARRAAVFQAELHILHRTFLAVVEELGEVG